MKKRTGTPRSQASRPIAMARWLLPVLASGDEVEVLELRAPPVGGHLQVGPVIAVEGLVGGEAGLFEQAQAFGSLARVEFGREPSFDEVELVGRGLGERAGEHAACQGQAAAHLQDAFAFLGRGRAPASGLLFVFN